MSDGKKIAFLGLGAMGSRMAARLLQAGHQVTVWNRNPAPTLPLKNLGALVAETPHMAVRKAHLVIAMVRDDTASSSVWLDTATGALAGMEQGAIAIESSTLTMGHIRNLERAAKARGLRFLDAPVAGSLPQAEAGQLIFMAGGDAAVLADAAPCLMAMGSGVHHAGDAGAGTAIKLAVNALLGIQVAAVAELAGMLEANGVALGHALEIISATSVASPAMRAAATSILAKAFTPLFPVELAEKDLGYAEAASTGRLPITTAARAVMNEAIAAGYGKDHLTGIARLY